jgi:hypothetical protein
MEILKPKPSLSMIEHEARQLYQAFKDYAIKCGTETWGDGCDKCNHALPDSTRPGMSKCPYYSAMKGLEHILQLWNWYKSGEEP